MRPCGLRLAAEMRGHGNASSLVSGEGPGNGPEISRAIAFPTFNRPPETTRPCQSGNGSTVAINNALSAAGLSEPSLARSNAAAPATCGQAIDVPNSLW